MLTDAFPYVDLYERLEVLNTLFRVVLLKNAHRPAGPSIWDSLFKDSWFASVWNAYVCLSYIFLL